MAKIGAIVRRPSIINGNHALQSEYRDTLVMTKGSKISYTKYVPLPLQVKATKASIHLQKWIDACDAVKQTNIYYLLMQCFDILL